MNKMLNFAQQICLSKFCHETFFISFRDLPFLFILSHFPYYYNLMFYFANKLVIEVYL